MTDPRAVIHTETAGGWLVTETASEVLEAIARGGMVRLWATTYEGHEFEVAVRADAIVTVRELTPERRLFEQQAFMAQRADEEARVEAQRRMGEMAHTVTRDLSDDDA